MNVGMAQQGGFHIACFPVWFDREIDVWKVEHDGASYIEERLDHVTEMLKEMDDGGHYTITKLKMKRGEYEQLPEFKGF